MSLASSDDLSHISISVLYNVIFLNAPLLEPSSAERTEHTTWKVIVMQNWIIKIMLDGHMMTLVCYHQEGKNLHQFMKMNTMFSIMWISQYLHIQG
jgi:hypothetical protein